MTRRKMRLIAAFLPLPFIVAGAIGAGVVGAAAWNLHSEAEIAQERAEKQAVADAEALEKWGDPATWKLPELYVIEPYDPEHENMPS